MTKDGSNARKQAARALAEAEGIPYTEALRRIEPISDAFLPGSRRSDDAPAATTGTATVASTRPTRGPRVTVPVTIRTTDTVLIGHTSPVRAVAFHPDGRTLVTGADVTVRLWDLASRQTTTALTVDDSLMAATLSPDGRTLAVASLDGPVSLWTIDTGEIRDLTAVAGRIQELAFSPDGRVLAASDEQYEFQHVEQRPWTEHTVRLWDLATGEVTGTRSRLDGYGHALAFHPDGRTLVGNSGMDGTAQLLDRAAGRVAVLTGHTGGINVAAFSPDGRMLATGSVDFTVRLWDVATGETISTLAPHSGYVVAVCFSPDGRTLASAGLDSTVRLWDVATGRNTASLFGHTDYVASVAFSPDGRTLASGSHDKTVRLWTLP